MSSFDLGECNETILGVRLVDVRNNENHVQLHVVMQDAKDLSTVLKNTRDAIKAMVSMRDRDKMKAIRDIMSESTYLDETGNVVLVMHVERTPMLGNALPYLRNRVGQPFDIAVVPVRVEHLSIDCLHTNTKLHTHQIVWDFRWYQKQRQKSAVSPAPYNKDDEIGDLLQVVDEYTSRINTCNETLQSAVRCLYHGDVKEANHILETVGACIPRVHEHAQ